MSFSGFAHAAARITVGTLFVGHGLRKLAPVLGGLGLDGATAQMDALGLRPPRPNAVAAGATQLAGGGLLAVGLFTPLASAVVAANMIVAMRTSCAGKGPWGVDGGWEYPLVLTATALALAEHGAGPLSLDRALGKERSGTAATALSLGAAAGGSAAVLAARGRSTSPPV